jgi:16S rRNA processing protein RimM
MLEFLSVGKIVNTHGIKGEVKILPLTDYPERFEELKWVYMDFMPNKKTSENLQKIEIESVKYFKNTVILKFKGIDNIDSALALKNVELKVDRKHAVKLPKDSYFICDLLECDVYNENDIKLGNMIDIIKTGSNDVYVVKPMQGKDILIPALKKVILDINIKDKKIKVQLPEGLLDDEV